MIDFDKLKEAGKRITGKLDKIRTKLGVEPVDFSLAPIIIETRTTKGIIESARGNKHRLITTQKGELGIAFIRNHTGWHHDNYDEEVAKHPNRCYAKGNKMHFHTCQHLINMKKDERYDENYDVTNSFSDEQTIDLPPMEDPRVEPTRLAFCKFCIEYLIDQVPKLENTPKKRGILAQYSDVKKMMYCVQLIFEDSPEFESELEQFIEETVQFSERKKHENSSS